MNLTIFGLALLSGLLHATWNFFSKKKAAEDSVIITGETVANISLLPITCLLIYLYGFDNRCLIYVLFSGILEGLAFLLIIKSYQSSDISMAYPVSRGTGVMLIAIFGTLIFKEQISNLSKIGIIFVLIGIFMFSFNRGSSLKQIWESTKKQKYALLIGVCMVFYTFVDRYGVKYCNPLVYFNLTELLAMILVTPLVFKGMQHVPAGLIKTMKSNGGDALIIGFGIVFSYVIILMIYNMFADAKASCITPVRECSVVIGSIFGFIFLKEKVTLNKLAGILTIVAGVIMIKVG